MRSLLCTSVILGLCGPLSGCGETDEAEATLTVMTRNLYLGGDFSAILAASTPGAAAAVAASFWSEVEASDIPARIGLVADEIAAHRPDLVGLQEVELFRVQSPGDFDFDAPEVNATEVRYDFLALLLAALEQRGLRYAVAAENVLTDAELPTAMGAGATDVRLTDRDVLLLGEGLAATEVENRVFAGRFGPITVGGSVPVSLLRGYSTARVDTPLGELRVANSHLEVELLPAVQEDQARELAQALGPASPLIVLGDFNSPAAGTGTRSYDTLTAQFADAWLQSGSREAGLTCCSALTASSFTAETRIDLVLSRGFTADAALVTGTSARTTAGRLASDHAGVVATLRLAP